MSIIAHWLPEINENILISISKTIKETLENDPLLFVPIPICKIMNGSNRFQEIFIRMLFIYISQDHHLDILCRQVKNKVDTLQITENKYKNGELLYSRLAATVDLESKLIKFTYKDSVYSNPMRECNIELMKILEKLNLVKLDQE